MPHTANLVIRDLDPPSLDVLQRREDTDEKALSYQGKEGVATKGLVCGRLYMHEFEALQLTCSSHLGK